MKSPKDMKIIEIDITNVCTHECSNCTRFCGHHKKGFFMELDTVKAAIDSLEGFDGSIGLIGGEPTLHPQFEEIAKYIATKFPKNEETDLLYPQKKFMQAIQDLEMTYGKAYHNGCKMASRIKGPLLLSTMGAKYAEHYEVIQDVFQFQLLNDHGNEMYHDPILVSRKDLKIPDEEWTVLRDNCWIQNEWSASITPKGAFFCEVAGTLDMLFDGPGGWAVEPNWWKREVSDFSDQLHWCEICGVACETYTRNANEAVDDVSPTVYEKLKEIGSKKLERGKINKMIIDENGVIAEESIGSRKRFTAAMSYAENFAAKFSMKESNLFPKAFEAIVVLDAPLLDAQKQRYEKLLLAQFQKVYFICENELIQSQLELPQKYNATSFCHSDAENLHELLANNEKRVYTTVFSGGYLPKENFVKELTKCILNPGTLLYSENECATLSDWLHIDGEGQFLLFSRNASSLKQLKGDFSNIKGIFDLKSIWKSEKAIPIDANIFPKAISNEIEKGVKYAIYGTGIKGGNDIKCIEENGGIITCVFDTNKEKQGTIFAGQVVDAPEHLKTRKNEYDKIVISTNIYYAEVKQTLLDYGFTKNDIVFVI